MQACMGLNGMSLGDKKLIVQRASIGKNPLAVCLCLLVRLLVFLSIRSFVLPAATCPSTHSTNCAAMRTPLHYTMSHHPTVRGFADQHEHPRGGHEGPGGVCHRGALPHEHALALRTGRRGGVRRCVVEESAGAVQIHAYTHTHTYIYIYIYIYIQRYWMTCVRSAANTVQ